MASVVRQVSEKTGNQVKCHVPVHYFNFTLMRHHSLISNIGEEVFIFHRFGSHINRFVWEPRRHPPPNKQFAVCGKHGSK